MSEPEKIFMELDSFGPSRLLFLMGYMIDQSDVSEASKTRLRSAVARIGDAFGANALAFPITVKPLPPRAAMAGILAAAKVFSDRVGDAIAHLGDRMVRTACMIYAIKSIQMVAEGGAGIDAWAYPPLPKDATDDQRDGYYLMRMMTAVEKARHEAGIGLDDDFDSGPALDALHAQLDAEGFEMPKPKNEGQTTSTG